MSHHSLNTLLEEEKKRNCKWQKFDQTPYLSCNSSEQFAAWKAGRTHVTCMALWHYIVICMALWPSLFPWRTASISLELTSPHPRKFFPMSVNFPKLPEIFPQLANWNSLVSSQVKYHNPVERPQRFPDTSDLYILETGKCLYEFK